LAVFLEILAALENLAFKEYNANIQNRNPNQCPPAYLPETRLLESILERKEDITAGEIDYISEDVLKQFMDNEVESIDNKRKNMDVEEDNLDTLTGNLDNPN